MTTTVSQRKVYEFDKALQAAEFIVEASSFERQTLWERWAKEAKDLRDVPTNNRRIQWMDQSSGWLETVGYLDERPVNIVVSIAILNGHAVVFYEAVSQVVDWKIVEEWFRKRCWPKWDNDLRRAHSDAMNFHYCIEVVTTPVTSKDGASE